MRNLGEMFDYVQNACKMKPEMLWGMFIAIGYTGQFGNGVPGIVAGRSRTELAMKVIRKSGIMSSLPEPRTDDTPSVFYWCGWILAYYQWYIGHSFPISENIFLFNILKAFIPCSTKRPKRSLPARQTGLYGVKAGLQSFARYANPAVISRKSWLKNPA